MREMSRIAVDVVLLPDQDMTRRAIESNRELVEQYSSEIVLGHDTCLPHISLAMGCIDTDYRDSIRGLLARLSREPHPTHLTATGIVASANSRGGYTSIMEIEKTAEFLSFHEKVMQAVEPLFSHDVNEAMIADDTVAASTLEWIRDYPRKAAFERFSPHITLGYGKATSDEAFPIGFRVSHLALCHVGNHGTCRRVLVSVDL
jgi:2'-5' RNA ligase